MPEVRNPIMMWSAPLAVVPKYISFHSRLPSICLIYIFPSIHPSIFLSVYLSVYLSDLYLSINSSVYLSVCLSVWSCLSVYLSICTKNQNIKGCDNLWKEETQISASTLRFLAFIWFSIYLLIGAHEVMQPLMAKVLRVNNLDILSYYKLIFGSLLYLIHYNLWFHRKHDALTCMTH